MARVAVVTGSNKGIGFACVRALCKQMKPDSAVYLTARNLDLGKKAVAELETEGLKPRFHQLDITNQESVEALRDHLKKEHGGLDILISNAGFAFKVKDPTPPAEQAKVTCEINYFGTAMIFNILSPILRSHARVVNVSSLAGKRTADRFEERVKQVYRDAVTLEELDAAVHKFIDLMASGEAEEYGYKKPSSYGTAALAICVLSRIQNKEIQKDSTRSDIYVYSVCPGRVKTGMSSFTGDKTPDEAVDTPVWLALEGTTKGAGEFFADRKVAEYL